METVGAFQAKTHFSQLLDRVAAGEKITITRSGKPVALLIPVQPGRDKKTIQTLVEEIRATRKGTRLAGLGVKALVTEGRKY